MTTRCGFLSALGLYETALGVRRASVPNVQHVSGKSGLMIAAGIALILAMTVYGFYSSRLRGLLGPTGWRPEPVAGPSVESESTARLPSHPPRTYPSAYNLGGLPGWQPRGVFG